MMWKQKLSTDTKDFWVDYQVERLTKCTPLEFCKKAYSRYHPVILTDLIDHWPALTKWNEEYFHELLDDKPISVNLTPDGRADSVQNVDYEGVRGDFFIYPAEVQMTMQEFFHLFHQKDEKIVPYLSQQNDNLRREFHELLGDIDLDLPLAELFESQEPEAVNLWIGDERSVSSIHKDHFENFYAVISGEKTFTLMPPTDIAFLPEQTFPALKYEAIFHQEEGEEETKISGLKLTKDGCPADMLSWISVDPDDELTHTNWSDQHLCSPIRCTVKAGEILYIPAMWYHRVSQNCMTIAVNMWYDQRFDFRYIFYEHISDRKHNRLEKEPKEDE